MTHTIIEETKRWTLVLCVCVLAVFVSAENPVWHTPSANSSESMPCGGGDIGMNVWVENGELLFYISRSGTFDEHNCLLKQGRIRLRLSPNPFREATDFKQELKLQEGYVEVSAGGTTIQLWADVFKPVVHLEVQSRKPLTANVSYENWRYQDRPLRKGEGQQNSYKWAFPAGTATTADSIRVQPDGSILFFHRNPGQTVFDAAVDQQGMSKVKQIMRDPLSLLTSGGCIWAEQFDFHSTDYGTYAGTDFKAWTLQSKSPKRSHAIHIALYTEQSPDIHAWETNLNHTISSIQLKKDREKSRQWWAQQQQRSFIRVPKGSPAEEMVRNYTLFRYMLACNAYGDTPTKFNGGLFTFDPVYVDSTLAFTPDYRKWGGGTMTAQNQRLVYWPMLKSGDFDMMQAQFKFYMQAHGNAELRSQIYWQHAGACFSEQLENYGLPNPTEYGWKRPSYFDKGIEYNAWLEYQWDTVLEFCKMMLDRQAYTNEDISEQLPFIESCLTFFDEHYRHLARMRGRKELDGNGKLILYPTSACETYKMATDATPLVCGLRHLVQRLSVHPSLSEERREHWARILETIPDIPLHTVAGRTLIAPARHWERINNVEAPQLYPVFPWRNYQVGKEGLDIARDTYLYDADLLKFRSHIGWKQDNIFAACLGLTAEAVRLNQLKLTNGPHRFPAFWGPGFDWTPDHNWGGSGMIGLQEMLLQVADEEILIFPAWPEDWDVHFRLHAPGGKVVEARMRDGKAELISPKE